MQQRSEETRAKILDSAGKLFSARGFNATSANKLLVMIDGRIEYSPLFSGVFWNMLDYTLEDIERIEVIRGPGGAMWGANAVNGVVNVITKKASDTQGGLAYSFEVEDPVVVPDGERAKRMAAFSASFVAPGRTILSCCCFNLPTCTAISCSPMPRNPPKLAPTVAQKYLRIVMMRSCRLMRPFQTRRSLRCSRNSEPKAMMDLIEDDLALVWHTVKQVKR